MTAYVYLLECADGSFYAGWTNDLTKRLAKHQSGCGSKYTRSHLPVKLVYSEKFADRQNAMRREYQLKRMTHTEKEALIKAKGSDNIVGR